MLLEVGAALKICTQAYNVINKGLEKGHSAMDLMDRFGAFYDAKDQITAAEEASKQKPLLGGGSIEAEALRITTAKMRVAEQEKRLREIILLTVPNGKEFYTDMLRQRKAIRQRIIKQAKAKAARRKHAINIAVGLVACGVIAIVYSVLIKAIIAV
jgi:hypothetical protein